MNLLKLAFVFCFLTPSALALKYLEYLKTKADQILDSAGGNTECATHIKLALTDLVFRKSWALEMIDANAKLNPGIITGNLYQLGNFDQCVNIREVKNDTEIIGQYCSVIILPSTEYRNEFSFLLDSRSITDYSGVKKSFHVSDILSMVKLSFGLCIPKSCSIGNLQKIWNYIEHTFGLTIHAEFLEFACRYKGKSVEEYSVDPYIFGFFGLIFVIIVASTLYDVLVHQKNTKEEKTDNMLITFSLYTNTCKLFFSKSFEEDGYLSCLNGMKVISMFWIIHGHRLVANIFAGNLNGFSLFEWRKQVYNAHLIGGSFGVDTFFVLSGLLLTYSFLKYKTTYPNKPVSLVGFYMYRFLRLTPALLATILFYISVFKYLNDGPIWPGAMKKLAGSCYKTWWATLFFMTNLISLPHQCVEQSWYLAVDSQLYFLSPLILLNILRHPKRVVGCILLVGVVSAVYTYIITINNNYGAIYFEVNLQYMEYIYQPTFVRMTPWLVGVIFGYIIFKYNEVNINKILNILIWTFSLSVMTFIMYVHVIFTRNDYDAYRSAIFNSTSRPAWALAICLIVFLCVTGHGGLINKFLSLPIFNVMARLSYSMFLTHLGVILYLVGSKRTYDYFSNLKCFHDFWGDLVITLVVSTIFCLSFEYPVMAIAKIYYKKNSQKEQQKEVGTNTTAPASKKNYVVKVYSFDDSDLNKVKEKKKLKIEEHVKVKDN